MSDVPPADQTPDRPVRAPGSDAVTDSGYSYTVVDEAAAQRPPKAKREWTPLRLDKRLLVALIVVPALVVGLAAWFVASRTGDSAGGDARTNANVASVANVFYQQSGTVRRFEGQLPVGLPNDVPAYPGSHIVSSLVQVNGANASYLVIYDTKDNTDDVVHYFEEKFATDPWQIDASQDDRDQAVRQFSRIDDNNISGAVLTMGSKDAAFTTILEIVQVVSGAKDADLGDFKPPVSKSLPAGFPDAVPAYPDGVVIQTIYQRESADQKFGLTTISKDGTQSVIDFFRNDFQGKGWTVTDADASQSSLVNAVAIHFVSSDGATSGNVAAGEFADDKNYSQIDIQVTQLNNSSAP